MSSFVKICGVICEFNPFHNGHHLLLQQIHAAGGAVVTVLSGPFVQRGEPAIVSRTARVQCALACGADLVLELPTVWACAGAERFAAGGMAILNGLGCVDELWYGSEHPDASAHRRLAQLLCDPAFSHAVQAPLQSGCSFAAARMAAVEQLTDSHTAALLHCPNDTLAIEYAKALLQQNGSIALHPIQRESAPHDSNICTNGICSASLLRDRLRSGEFPKEGIPSACHDILQIALNRQGGPADPNLLARALLARLRTLSLSEAADLPDISEGLEHRLLQAARTADTLEALFAGCKTKRYAHARIRRLAWAALLGITEKDQAALPPYLRVLGLTDRGREILRTAQHTSTLPLITRPAEISALNPYAQRIFSLECTAADIWGLALPHIRPSGSVFTDEVQYFPTI